MIIVKPAGTVITRRTLKTGFQANPDGAGMMYTHDNVLEVVKGFFHFRGFYKTFRSIERAFPKTNIIVHFRITTSGLKNTPNCHPFVVDDTLAFAHNGIFLGLGTLLESDTMIFNKTVLQLLPKGFLDIPRIKEALDLYIQRGFCKLAFLDKDNNYTIINPSAGEWNNGVWFSNTSYEDRAVFGFTKYDYNGYDYSNTYRNCSMCRQLIPLREMEWHEEVGGFVCDVCNYSTQTSAGDDCEVCGVCGFYPSETSHAGISYCADCWNELTMSYKVHCPCCHEYTTLRLLMSDDYKCDSCGAYVTPDEYKDLLHQTAMKGVD